MDQRDAERDAGEQEAVFLFSPEEDSPLPIESDSPWKILVVDDDEHFQNSLRFALNGFKYLDIPIRLLHAYSSQEAALVFAHEPDIAVALLDVVMETDDAGLRLVKNVREILGNAETRIVLVTGQPGMAPLQQAVTDFDIDDYWIKTDLTSERLRGILTTRLRDWQRLTAINRARRGLRMIVDGSNAFTDARNLADFSARMVHELALLLGVPEEGIVCVMESPEGSPLDASIIAAAGGFADSQGQLLARLPQTDIRDALARCLAEQCDLSLPHGLALHFSSKHERINCAAYVAGALRLDPTQQDLLRVFATHINSALVNVALISKLDRMAFLDPLVQLPNRNALMRLLSALIERPPACPHSLLLLDIDDFSGVNLVLGFEHGNQLLRELAQRLTQRFAPPVVVARLHDDVFALLGPSPSILEEQLSVLGEQGPNGQAARPISFGIARLDLPDFSGSAEEAMAMTSLVLKSAKRRGYGQRNQYEKHMANEATQRVQLAIALHKAVAAEQISIALQPQVGLANGRVVSAEVLARWQRSDGSMVSPAEFIPVAEATGDIIRLGAQVFRLTVLAAQRLVAAGYPELRLAVNVSMLQLMQSGLLRGFLGELAQAGISPENIEIEITESIAMQSQHGILERLHVFHQAGFKVAVDDFGTGYSSLATLRELPVDVLKIDRAFVSEIDSQTAPIIAETVLDMARRLGLSVVAEGVETANQAAWLQQRGCGLAQGYHFGRPMSLDALLAHLELARADPGRR